jgi:hypothetical protein
MSHEGPFHDHFDLHLRDSIVYAHTDPMRGGWLGRLNHALTDADETGAVYAIGIPGNTLRDVADLFGVEAAGATLSDGGRRRLQRLQIKARSGASSLLARAAAILPPRLVRCSAALSASRPTGHHVHSRRPRRMRARSRERTWRFSTWGIVSTRSGMDGIRLRAHAWYRSPAS